MKIGVFDSGIGGEKIAQLLKQTYPNYEIVAVSDAENLPYGSKTKEQLLHLVIPIIQKMAQEGCNVIVIACNTVTTVLIKEIRNIIAVPIIGFEPMIKPAAKLTKSKTIAVCATPATLASKRYKELKELYAIDINVIEPDCSNWATLIEQNEITEKEISAVVTEVLTKHADVIVLGCTHYHWIEEEIAELAKGKAIILQPEEAIIRKLQDILLTLDN